MSTAADSDPSGSPWMPLRHRVLRMLRTASVFSNIGSWMHEAGAGRLMALLAPSPLMVAPVREQRQAQQGG